MSESSDNGSAGLYVNVALAFSEGEVMVGERSESSGRLAPTRRGLGVATDIDCCLGVDNGILLVALSSESKIY